MNEPLANTTTAPGAETGEQRAARLDFCRVDRVPRLGVEPEGLRPAPAPTKAQIRTERRSAGSKAKNKATRTERDEDSYVIESGLKILRVLECLEGRNFEPVTFETMMNRTGFNRSFVRDAMITLKKSGWVKEILDDPKKRFFIPGRKAKNFSKGYSGALLREQT